MKMLFSYSVSAVLIHTVAVLIHTVAVLILNEHSFVVNGTAGKSIT